MEYTDKEYCLEVWGAMACFTRPEFKVERVSYDVITPSAARAIFEAIFWKPAIKWEVTKIEVLRPVRWMSIKRNEVGTVASQKLAPIYIEEGRQQKNSLLLRDVKYRITAKLVFIPRRDRKDEKREGGNDENPAKYQAMFERRAQKGQCFNQPYLGTRECSASFRLVDPTNPLLEKPISESKDLNIMLYDMNFVKDEEHPEAMFYRAKMENGVIMVPPIDSKEVLR